MHRYGRELNARVLPIYGGQPIGRQVRTLETGVDVVVATPGRALDHLGRGTLSLAARSDGRAGRGRRDARHGLRRGHRDDPRRPHPPTGRRCCSRRPCRRASTASSSKYLKDPVHVQIRRERPAEGEAPLIRQVAYLVPRSHKASALGRLLDVEAPTATIVFCGTRARGRHARRDPHRAGLPGRGPARRHDPGPARQGHGPAAQRHRRTARRHRRRRARARRRAAHPRRQLRRPVRARLLRPPHRPGGPGRARGRGHHPGRTPPAPAAEDDREGHQAEDRRSSRYRPSPTCMRAGSS